MPRLSCLVSAGVIIFACFACSERARGETVTFTFSGTTNGELLAFDGLNGESDDFTLTYTFNTGTLPDSKYGTTAKYSLNIEVASLTVGGIRFDGDALRPLEILVDDGNVEDLDSGIDWYDATFTAQHLALTEDVVVQLSLYGPYLVSGTELPEGLDLAELGTASLQLTGSAYNQFDLSIGSFAATSGSTVPTPAAALAGPALLGMVALRRRRV